MAESVMMGQRVKIRGKPIAVTLRSPFGVVVRPDLETDMWIVRLDQPAVYHHADGRDEDLPEIRESEDNLIIAQGMTTEDRPIVVTRLCQTCEFCPSQWEGNTSDGRTVYVRYRWGYLSVRLSEKRTADIMAAVCGPEVYGEQLGGEYDGHLDFEAVRAATADLIIWPRRVHAFGEQLS